MESKDTNMTTQEAPNNVDFQKMKGGMQEKEKTKA